MGNVFKASASAVRHHPLAPQFASRDLERVREPLPNHLSSCHCTMGSQPVQELLNAHTTLENQATFLRFWSVARAADQGSGPGDSQLRPLCQPPVVVCMVPLLRKRPHMRLSSAVRLQRERERELPLIAGRNGVAAHVLEVPMDVGKD